MMQHFLLVPKDKFYTRVLGGPARLWLLYQKYANTQTPRPTLGPTAHDDLMNEGQEATLITSAVNQNQMFSATHCCHHPHREKNPADLQNGQTPTTEGVAQNIMQSNLLIFQIYTGELDWEWFASLYNHT